MKAWKVITAFLGSLGVAIILFWLWIGWEADHRWSQMINLIDRLDGKALRRPANRAVLRGRSSPGNAWDDYSVGLEEVRGFASQMTILGEFMDRVSTTGWPPIERILATHDDALAHIRKGTRRAESRNPYVRGRFPGPPYLLGQIAVCRGRLTFERGNAKEAAELLLDAAQFGRDVAYNGTLVDAMIGQSP